jgi:hypothetical protein
MKHLTLIEVTRADLGDALPRPGGEIRLHDTRYHIVSAKPPANVSPHLASKAANADERPWKLLVHTLE